MRWFARQSAGVALLAAGLVLVLPANPAAAAPAYPGSIVGDVLRVTFDNTGLPGFNTGPAALGVGAFRMDTGAGSGAGAGGKVFLHSFELDDQPLSALTSFSFQYFIDSTSPSVRAPYANLRVNNELLFTPAGARTLTAEVPDGVAGSFATATVPTGPTSGWVVTGDPITCNGTLVPLEFSLEELETI